MSIAASITIQVTKGNRELQSLRTACAASPTARVVKSPCSNVTLSSAAHIQPSVADVQDSSARSPCIKQHKFCARSPGNLLLSDATEFNRMPKELDSQANSGKVAGDEKAQRHHCSSKLSICLIYSSAQDVQEHGCVILQGVARPTTQPDTYSPSSLCACFTGFGVHPFHYSLGKPTDSMA